MALATKSFIISDQRYLELETALREDNHVSGITLGNASGQATYDGITVAWTYDLTTKQILFTIMKKAGLKRFVNDSYIFSLIRQHLLN